MALDLTTLKARIATELHRTDLTSNIADAITSAIAFYQSKRFEFNEKVDTFNTAASQESYTSGDTGFPTDIGQIDTVRIAVSGRRVPIDPITYAELQELSTTASLTGPPSKWAWYAQKLFFYPIPDAVYSITLSHQQRKTAPANDFDSSTIWTNQCEALIRHRAKRLLFRDVLRSREDAADAAEAEIEELARLTSEAAQLQDDGSPLTPQW